MLQLFIICTSWSLDINIKLLQFLQCTRWHKTSFLLYIHKVEHILLLFFYNNINIKCILYQQEIATNTTRSTDVNPDVNHAWLGSIWPSAGFVPKSAGFSAELIPLAMLEVPFLPDCVAIKKFQRKNGTNLILSPVHIIYLLALSLKLFYLQTSMSCSWKWQNMQFFAFFFFLVLIAYKKTEENVQLQNTVLHANFFVSFCLKFIFQYLIIFWYISIKK